MRIAVVISALWLSGCSTLFGDSFRDRSEDYLTTEPVASTTTPEGMTPLVYDDALAIPELPVVPERPDSFTVPRPAPLDVDDNDTDSASLAEYRSEALNPRLDQDGAGTQILRLDSGYAQSWASVTEAISASDLKLMDLNRSTGTFFLQITPEVDESKQGFWSPLFGNDEPEAQVFLLKMNRAHSGVYLSLLTDNDNLADEALTQSVLSEVLRQLES
ncbi:hypothetical protein CHH28_12645 [Bacterioplanes sanyensis]|uniref:Outer membrane protein assembly factor BamC n=1 Tax=Bacterioplanes sanyensis TaxID=1249553 RepID=A0A222FL30_9GAMM|nr:outer membrane protein assembly factor BamC [Bacterioplanes sanyensis]ASP39469.1 hypothetical protein CHH28_12645 [Bacterioplanes sanyensis]